MPAKPVARTAAPASMVLNGQFTTGVGSKRSATPVIASAAAMAVPVTT